MGSRWLTLSRLGLWCLAAVVAGMRAGAAQEEAGDLYLLHHAESLTCTSGWLR